MEIRHSLAWMRSGPRGIAAARSYVFQRIGNFQEFDMVTTKTKPKTRSKQPDVDQLLATIERYEEKFGEIDSFLHFVRNQRDELHTKTLKMHEAKEVYEAVRAEVKELQDSISGAKDSLFRMLEPGVMEFLPLFDRMEPADPDKHGENAEQWRRDPISALRLSSQATTLLIDHDIVVVGQLQDRVLDSPEEWWERIGGLTAAVAAAILDKLNDFIYRDGGRA